MRRIGLMGGSFNPIHLAHVHLARAALDGGHVDEVIFLPTGHPPHKGAELASSQARYEMTCLAVAGEARMSVSREEIDRQGVIYTVDTLRALHRRMPDARFTYLIGADTLLLLPTWREIDTVITLCGFLVCMRPGEDDVQAQEAAALWRAKGAQVVFMDAARMAMSSTEIRRRLRAGLPTCGMLDARVERYIREHGLYGTQDTDGTDAMKREKIMYKLKKELDAQRFTHTLGVEETARQMALLFGEDAQKAAMAGLLHDCAKCMTLTQMVKAAKGVPLDPVMKESKALMHAVAGMCVARNVYGVDDPEVLGAIRWHTTGHAGMTRLEKIVYLADMIEPNRKPYPGLEEIRALCWKDLDQAMHTALAMSLEHVVSQGKTLHPDTLAALQEYEHGTPV